MPLSRAQKKYLAIERAKRRLMHRLEDIDWELDELQPAAKRIAELEASNRVEIGVGDDRDDDQD